MIGKLGFFNLCSSIEEIKKDIIESWTKKNVRELINIIPNVRMGEDVVNLSGFSIQDLDEEEKNQYVKRLAEMGLCSFEQTNNILEATIGKLNDMYEKAKINDTSIFDTIPIQKEAYTEQLQKDLPQLCILQKNNEEFMSFGDNHGGFVTIAQYMLSRVNDNFELKDKSKKYIFLGDSIDRGPAGLPSILFICVLLSKNPQNIFFVRGNHETEKIYSSYGFLWELLELFPNKDDQKSIILKINELFTRLPIVLYALKENSNIFNMYMHGCIDKDDNVEEIAILLNECKNKDFID